VGGALCTALLFWDWAGYSANANVICFGMGEIEDRQTAKHVSGKVQGVYIYEARGK